MGMVCEVVSCRIKDRVLACAPIGPYAMQFGKRDLLICFPIGANHSDAEASEAKCVNACLFSSYHPTLLSWRTTLLRKRAPWRGFFFTFYTFTLYTFILGCGEAWRNTRVASGEFFVVQGDLAVHLGEKMRVRLSLLMFATTFLCRCCGPFCLLFRPSRLVHGLKCPLNFSLKDDSISIPQLFLFIFLLWCVQEIALSTSWFHMVVLVAAPIRDDYGGVFLVFFTKWSTTRIMPPQTKQNQQGDTHTRVICAWGVFLVAYPRLLYLLSFLSVKANLWVGLGFRIFFIFLIFRLTHLQAYTCATTRSIANMPWPTIFFLSPPQRTFKHNANSWTGQNGPSMRIRMTITICRTRISQTYVFHCTDSCTEQKQSIHPKINA